MAIRFFKQLSLGGCFYTFLLKRVLVVEKYRACKQPCHQKWRGFTGRTITLKFTIMETKNIAKAIIAVMKAVKGIEKNLKVGEGKASYQGVSDKDVKGVIGKAMEDNGLCILPINVEAKTQVDRWQQEEFYNGQSNGIKQKQQVFTEVKTKYLLLHESGESIEIEGYGHGVDSQDKSAGKATTYALKNALLYSFMVPTGTIDDTDATHSEDYKTPKTVLPEMSPTHVKWNDAVNAIKAGKTTIAAIKTKYSITPQNEIQLLKQSQNAA